MSKQLERLESEAENGRILTVCHSWQNLNNELITLATNNKSALADYSAKASLAIGMGEDSNISEEVVHNFMSQRFYEIARFIKSRPGEFFDSLPELDFPSDLFDNGNE